MKNAPNMSVASERKKTPKQLQTEKLQQRAGEYRIIICYDNDINNVMFTII